MTLAFCLAGGYLSMPDFMDKEQPLMNEAEFLEKFGYSIEEYRARVIVKNLEYNLSTLDFSANPSLKERMEKELKEAIEKLTKISQKKK